MNTLLNSTPSTVDTAILVPDMTLVNMEHLIEILEHGAADISVEERRTYFEIVEEAQNMGIHLDNVSIFKKRMDRVEIEKSKDNYQAHLKDIGHYKGESNYQEIIMGEGLIHNGDDDYNLQQKIEGAKSSNVTQTPEETVEDEVKYTEFRHKENGSKIFEPGNNIRKKEMSASYQTLDTMDSYNKSNNGVVRN